MHADWLNACGLEPIAKTRLPVTVLSSARSVLSSDLSTHGPSCCAQCIGSCALNLCSIAAGRADAFYEIGFGGPWDVAAGALILEEAGGAVTDPAGKCGHSELLLE